MNKEFEKIKKDITNKILNLESKYNFDRNKSKKQLGESKELIEQYAEYKALTSLAKRHNIEIPEAPKKQTKTKKGYVYFAHPENNFNTWKVGYSTNPYQRLKQHSTSNHEKLEYYKKINGEREMERKALHLLDRVYKAKRSGNGREWFTVDKKIIDEVIKELKKD
jgi:hypothetical protein